MLDLRDTKNGIIGSVSVRLEMKSSGPLNPITVRNGVTSLQSAVLNAKLDRTGRLESSPAVQAVKDTGVIAGEISDSGLEQLESVTGKLGKQIGRAHV